MSKPFSRACENNKAPILAEISRYFAPGTTVLEIGSYTTQHVQYFAGHLPEVLWQPSDTPDNLKVVRAGLEGISLGNILQPITLEVSQQPWAIPDQVEVGGIFSANTLHIMSENHVIEFFKGIGEVLRQSGFLCVYGPFKYGGKYTSDSNARFQEWLKEQDPVSGIRDFETVNTLAEKAGMSLVADHAMPANNQLLVWQKQA